jgi:hypothetical protein
LISPFIAIAAFAFAIIFHYAADTLYFQLSAFAAAFSFLMPMKPASH